MVKLYVRPSKPIVDKYTAFKIERTQKWEGKNGNKFKKTVSGRIEMAGDFSMRVDTHLEMT